MSLVTRCPACDMVFRVVQDQLKVSGGWVRCGHCDEVFNALESLFEAEHLPTQAGGLPTTDALEQGQTPMLREPLGSASTLDSRLYSDFAASTTLLPSHFGPEPAGTRRAPTWDLDRRPSPPPAKPSPVVPVAAPEAVTPAPLAPPKPAPQAAPQSVKLAQPPEPVEPLTERLDLPEPLLHTPAQADASGEPAGPNIPTPPLAAPTAPAAPSTTDAGPSTLPHFMRQPDPAKGWHQHPVAKLVMGLACLLLLGTLGLQVLIQQRNELATSYVGLRPVLLKLCKLAGCELESPRMIEQIVLVSSQIQQTGQQGVLHLTAELHNSARHPVLTPALDLTLTDAYGQVLVRKVLIPKDLRAKTDSLQASGSWLIDSYVQAGSLPVAGFSIELFYP